MDVRTADGPVVRVKYAGVKRKESAGYVTVQTLLAARGSRFPSRAVWVQPVGRRRLQVSSAEPGSELYSDDPAHQLTSVPQELHGGKLIMTDCKMRKLWIIKLPDLLSDYDDFLDVEEIDLELVISKQNLYTYQQDLHTLQQQC